MTGRLSPILAATRARVAQLRPRRSQLARDATRVPKPPRWVEAFRGGEVAVIGEVKRRSPSSGAIAEDLSPAEHARAYVRGGAVAVSVLTDELHFGGSLRDLEEVRGAVAVPLLRKDFILDQTQLYEARIHGASAVLLIVRALGPGALRELSAEARELGLARLVEVHGPDELERALEVGPEAVGVNARDLDTLVVDLPGVEPVLRSVPADVIAIAESGVAQRADVERVAKWGADAVLVGTALASARDPAEATRQLTGVPRVGRADGRAGGRAVSANRPGGAEPGPPDRLAARPPSDRRGP
jgi:indole-3-glycerol phosphate synthase